LNILIIFSSYSISSADTLSAVCVNVGLNTTFATAKDFCCLRFDFAFSLGCECFVAVVIIVAGVLLLL